MVREKHEKQRLMFYRIKDFLENGHSSRRIGVLTGIRKIGKTGILTDLAVEFGDWSQYIDLRPGADPDAAKKLHCALSGGVGYLLLDEITQYPQYERLVDGLLHAIYAKGNPMKVVMTGSSTLHLLALHYQSLGGGRSELFRLSFLSFVEYLHFVGKLERYEVANPSQQDFFDYLQLKGLEGSGLDFVLDSRYMQSLHSDIVVSNEAAANPLNTFDFSLRDLECMVDVVAYTLNQHATFDAMRRPDTSHLGVEESEQGGLRIVLSAEHISSLGADHVASLLYFLLEANLAYVEIRYEDKRRFSASNAVRELRDLRKVQKSGGLHQFLYDYNICLKSPIWFTRLANDVLARAGLEHDALYSSVYFGHMLENYVKGSYCDLCLDVNYQVYKLGSPERHATIEEHKLGSPERHATIEERKLAKEIDLYDQRNQLMCEITTSTKDYREVNLMGHNGDIDCIRVVSTAEDGPDQFSAGTHKMPWPKLCVAVDTGHILTLERSKDTRKSNVPDLEGFA